MDHLPSHPLFQTRTELLTPDQRVSLSYQRAKLVVNAYRLSARDIEVCSPRFWEFMTDPILSQDIAMFTLIAAHIGLALGTLSRHMAKRPDFKLLVQRLLRFDTVGLYLLTERGHGLDAFNIETTATKTADGYILHTPREEASKFMPPTTPAFNVPKVALVVARLIVEGQDHGCRTFIVPICNERDTYRGISSTRLPPRSGTGPLDFAVTTFNNVRLPPTALVASDIFDTAKCARPLEAWWDEIWRIQLGTMTVSAPWISAIKSVAYIAGRYSLHRSLLGKSHIPTPIISFRTQQWPIAHATATGMVLGKWYLPAIQSAMQQPDPRLRHAFSVIIKTTVCRHFQRAVAEVAERCGAQGTFEHNYLARIENDGKGVIIAEGDVLTLCIRLFSELVQRQYTIPLPKSTESALAYHAISLLEENIEIYQSLKAGHRSPTFNSLLLPQAELVVESMGHALAYSAAMKAGLPQPILDVYECAIIRRDPAWYTEKAGINRMQQRLREDAAVTSFMPHIEEFLDQLDIAKYVSAPIVSDSRWKEYIQSLPSFSGNAIPQLMPHQALL